KNAYLRMDVMLGNEVVVCPVSRPISGLSDWAVFESNFVMDENHIPDSAKLNIVFDSRGTVWVKDLELLYLPAEGVAPTSAGWVHLFNGKDLAGWKYHPDQPGDWKVSDGILIGSGRPSFLFSDRGDYENFHLWAEVKINEAGNSGVFFRAGYELTRK